MFPRGDERLGAWGVKVPSKKIAIIGAGPVGLECAVYGACLGHDVRLFERGRLGDHMRQWGHTRLFSPWSFNHSPLGARLLGDAAISLPGADASTSTPTSSRWPAAPRWPVACSRILA